MKIKIIFLFILVLLIFPPNGFSADVTLAWDPVPGTDVAGYRIYAREAGQQYDYNDPEDQIEETQVTLTGFDEYESYYFVVRAMDAYGNESGDSNEVYWDPAGTNGPGGGSALASDDATPSGGGGASSGCFISSLLH